MTVQEFKSEARSLIGKAKTDEAIEVMGIYFQETADEDALHEVTVLMASRADLKKKIIKRIISTDEEILYRNKINDSLLAICNGVQDPEALKASNVKKACKDAHGLLMYLSENTNSKAVFIEDVHRNYYFRKPQGREFINELSKLYLEKGYGNLIPKDVTADFYKIKAKVQKIIDHAEVNGNQEDRILVSNEDIKKLVTALRLQISKRLKECM